jgi:hypothetical protein
MLNLKFFFAGAIALLLAIAPQMGQNSSRSGLPIARESAQAPGQMAIYLAIAPDSAADFALGQDVLHEIAGKTAAHQWLVVDVLQGDTVANVYSNQPTRRAVQEIMTQLHDPIESSDRALLQAFQRLENLIAAHQGRKSFHGYLITAGTHDPATLAAIQAVCAKLAQTHPTNAHLYVLGVAADRRLKLAAALGPLRERVQFAGTADSEWIQLVRQF